MLAGIQQGLELKVGRLIKGSLVLSEGYNYCAP